MGCDSHGRRPATAHPEEPDRQLLQIRTLAGVIDGCLGVANFVLGQPMNGHVARQAIALALIAEVEAKDGKTSPQERDNTSRPTSGRRQTRGKRSPGPRAGPFVGRCRLPRSVTPSELAKVTGSAVGDGAIGSTAKGGDRFQNRQDGKHGGDADDQVNHDQDRDKAKNNPHHDQLSLYIRRKSGRYSVHQNRSCWTRTLHRRFACRVGHVVEIAVRIAGLIVHRRRQHVLVNCQEAGDCLDTSGSRDQMAHHALDAGDGNPRACVPHAFRMAMVSTRSLTAVLVPWALM